MKQDELIKILKDVEGDVETLQHLCTTANGFMHDELADWDVDSIKYVICAGQVRMVIKAMADDTDFSPIIRKLGQ